MNIPSLLPYVMSETNGIHLKLTVSKNTETQGAEIKVSDASGVYKIMDDPDGLTRLYEASLMTDAGSAVSRLFLLVQKTRYGVAGDEVSPVNNMDVELCWQRAFMYYTKESREMPVHLFSGQKGMGDILLPFHALFYCREKEAYFHPPCPQCGGTLVQCHDDEMLASAGLPTYSGSLERFLFCPACHESGQSAPFYVSDRDGRYDPAVVKDQNDLIRAFGNIGDDQAAAFPCASCDKHDQCYGGEYLAGVNIIPFSFYPFYMLAFDAGSMNAVDFVSLLSDVTAEDLAADIALKNMKGRASCVEKLKQQAYAPAFFFKENDDRRFLEILYLKLTFLQEVFTHFFSHMDNPHYPNPEMSLERVWVRLNNRVGLLPFFWNFNVLPFSGVTGHGKKSLKDEQALPFHRLYYMGVAWLRVLIAHQENNISTISDAVMQSVEIADIADENAWNTFLLEEYPAIFTPEHVSRKSDSLTIDEDSTLLFQKALKLGMSLIRAGLGYDPKWSEVTFDLDLTTLRETIAGHLFPHIHHPGISAEDDSDRKIKKILTKIKKKILADEDIALPDSMKDHEIATETVILTPSAPSSPETPSPDEMKETMVGPNIWNTKQEKDPDDLLDKTVIRKTPEDLPTAGDTIHALPQDEAEEDEPGATVIYRPSHTGSAESPGTGDTPANTMDDDDVFSETVMLGSERLEDSKKTLVAPAPAAPPPDEDDDLSKTVVLREAAPEKPVKAPENVTPENEDDDLEKTRVIRQQEPEKTIKKNLWGDDSVDDNDEDDFLEKTVLIGKRKKPDPGKK